MTLRAIVVGAGQAGEAHTRALRAADVDVVALCGRTPAPARAMADKLAVAEVRFDWRAALDEFRPDIITIATPTRPNRDIAVAAAEAGCHVVCEKPLAVHVAEAHEMVAAVERAGVKHGYAATSCYAPVFGYARQLLANGIIGQVFEIDYLSHIVLPPLIPYAWVHRLEEGGGFLNGIWTHQLQQVLSITGGHIRAVAGEARIVTTRIPLGPTIHDFRDLFGAMLTREEAAVGQWCETDADDACTVIVRLQLPQYSQANVLFRNSGVQMAVQPATLTVFGTIGMVRLSGPFWPNTSIEHFAAARGEWQELALPEDVVHALSPADDANQWYWNQFFCEFVADVRGEGYAGYPTFRDGAVAVEAIDIVRSGRSWAQLPVHGPGRGGFQRQGSSRTNTDE